MLRATPGLLLLLLLPGARAQGQCTLARTAPACGALSSDCHWCAGNAFCAPDSEPCPPGGAAAPGGDLGPNTLTTFSWTPTSPADRADESYSFGAAIGSAFADNIRARVAADTYLTQTLVVAFTAPGAPRASVYRRFLQVNNDTYPKYVRELEGMASASGVPFGHLFLMQMKEEFTYFVPNDGAGGARGRRHPAVSRHNPERCSDLLWAGDEHGHTTYLAHNEDSGADDLNHTALISAPQGVAGGPAFTAFTYLGNTPTGAFGWNEHRLLFTMNYVAPGEADPAGLGRVFMARDLLEMTSVEDGLARITRTGPGIAAGHNYQLFDVGARRLMNVEVSAFGLSSVRQMTRGSPAFFHANTFQTLNVPGQMGSNSSSHRDARAAAMLKAHPIRGPADMLAVIGDQTDRGWPIYHDNLSHERGEHSDWTLGSILVEAGPCQEAGEGKEGDVCGTVDVWNTNPRDTQSRMTVHI